MAVVQGYSGNLGGGYLAGARKRAKSARDAMAEASSYSGPYAFAAREGTKGYLKNQYGIDAKDSDITWNDGQVYLYGQSLGKADDINPQEGKAYYRDPGAVTARIDKIVENMPDPGTSRTYNDVNSVAMADRSAIADEYGRYFDQVRGWTDPETGWINPKIEAAIRSSYDYGKSMGANQALASGAARNSGNIDSLSMQNRANYDLAVNSAVNQAILDALSANREDYRSGLDQYGGYVNTVDANNLVRQKNDQDYDIALREAARLDDESRAAIDNDRSRVTGVNMGQNNLNPFLVNGKLPENWAEIDYQAIYDTNAELKNAAMANYNATGDERYLKEADNYQTTMDQAMAARALKLQKPGYGKWADTQVGYDQGRANGQTVERDANDQSYDLGLKGLLNEKEIEEVKAEAQKYGYDKELEGIKDTNITNRDIEKIKADGELEGIKFTTYGAIRVAEIGAQADVDVAKATAAATEVAAKYKRYADVDSAWIEGHYQEISDRIWSGAGDDVESLPYSGVKAALGLDSEGDELAPSDFAAYLNDKLRSDGYNAAVGLDSSGELEVSDTEARGAILDTLLNDKNMTAEEKRHLRATLGM